MKYGLLARQEWIPAEEGYPDNTFVIVLLTNGGHIADYRPEPEVDPGYPVGSGLVYRIEGSAILHMGYVLIPMDAVVYGIHDSETDAIEYARTQYANDTIELEKHINAQIDQNRDLDTFIDDTIRYQRFRQGLRLAVILVLIALAIFALILIRRYTGIQPLFR